MKVSMHQLLQYYKLIFLTVLLGNSVHGVDKQGYFSKLPIGYSLSIKDNSHTTFPVMSAGSVIYCSRQCLTQPLCKYFTYDNGLCQMYHVWEDEVIAKKDSNAKTYVLLEDDMTWHRVYSIKAGSNIHAFDAYNDRSIINKPSLKYSQASCEDLFRSCLIDTWDTLHIEEVKLVFHNGTNDLLTLRFNGTGSNKTDWFAMDRVLSSPWTDFGKGKTSRVFTMKGNSNNGFISMKSANNCRSYTAWTYIVQAPRGCESSKHAQYPTFMFAKGSTASNWENKGYGTAERLSIYIRLA